MSPTAALLSCLIIPIVPLLLLASYVRLRRRRRGRHAPATVAFFHPYCDAGGGGERVLWAALGAMHRRYPSLAYAVFTGDTDSSPSDIGAKALRRFNTALPSEVAFVYLRSRRLVEASTYPVFTLLGQTVGGALLAVEALLRLPQVDVFVDSMGYPGSLAVFRLLLGCRTAAYVHYPTISTDMLRVVRDRTASYNNAGAVARSRWLSNAKWLYYWLFAKLYGVLGRCAHVAMVNSSWTRAHIVDLWQMPDRTVTVYPPCDVAAFRKLRSRAEADLAAGLPLRILSIGQFRPEKDHRLQIDAFARFLSMWQERYGDSEEGRPVPVLVLAGGCRHADDAARVQSLRRHADSLSIADAVEWRLNVPFDELCDELAAATIGLHSMWNEHFGIGVVECMSAGCVTLAHDSGGPKMDIVVPAVTEDSIDSPPTDAAGFLAHSVDGYAEAMMRIWDMGPAERDEMRRRARESAGRFDGDRFERDFLAAMSDVMDGIVQ